MAVLRKRFLAPEWVFIFGIGLGIEADGGARAGAAASRGYAGAAMRIVYVVGTRPNFVKTAPVIGALRGACPRAGTRSSTPASTTTG